MTQFIQNAEYEYQQNDTTQPTSKRYLGKYKDREPQLEDMYIKKGYFTYIFEHGAIGTGGEQYVKEMPKIYTIPDEPERAFKQSDTMSNYAIYSTSKLPIKLGKFIQTTTEWDDNWSYRDGPSQSTYYQFEENKRVSWDVLQFIKKVLDNEFETPI